MIIAFSGAMGSGKSTAIDSLRSFHASEHRFRPVFNVKFAETLYDIQEFIYDKIKSVYSKPPTFVKDRKLLQWIGTDWGRETISQTLWVDLWKARAKQLTLQSPFNIIVCDDVRFDNEAETVRSMGGFVVKINCDRNKERIDTASGIKHHASEAGINPSLIDYEVSNNGTVNEFKLAIRNLYGLIERRTTHNL